MRDEEKSTIHEARGLAYLKDGLLDKAIEEFKTSLSYASDNIDALVNLGTALAKKGSFDEEITILESVLKQDWAISDETFGTIFYNLGNSYRAKGLEEKAIEQYKKAIEKRPNHASTWFNLGQSYLGLGKWDDAGKAYDNALKYNPNHSDARIMLDFLNGAKATGDYEEMRKLVTKPKDEYENLMIAGEKHLLRGEINSAIEQFKEAIRLYPEEAGGYVKLAGAYFSLGVSEDKLDYETHQNNLELLEKAEKLISLGKPKHPIDKYDGLSELHGQKGRSYTMLNRWEEAIQEWDKALSIEPDNEKFRKSLELAKRAAQEAKSKSKGCFIATAIYSSEFAPEVQALRQFRDNCLSRAFLGKWMIETYYKFSPFIAEIVEHNNFLKRLARLLVGDPLVGAIKTFSKTEKNRKNANNQRSPGIG